MHMDGLDKVAMGMDKRSCPQTDMDMDGLEPEKAIYARFW